MKLLIILCQFLSIFGGVFGAVTGKWFMIPIAVCLLLGFVMWELHLSGIKGWWVKKKLDHHRRR